MSKKSKKLQPVLISSREGMLAVVSKLVTDKLDLAELNVLIEQEKAEIERTYQDRIDALTRQIQMLEGGLQVWSTKYPQEFDGKKSIDLPSARFGFRTGPVKVEKARSKETWDDIVARVVSIVDPEFVGENYIRYGTPTLDKDALLRDRKNIPDETLKAAGIRFEQEEFFFFEPKSEVLESTAREAA